MRSQKHVIKN